MFDSAAVPVCMYSVRLTTGTHVTLCDILIYLRFLRLYIHALF